MLRERGVDGVDSLVNGLDEEQFDGVFGAIRWWDDLPHDGSRAVGTGLLVNSIKDGGKPGYKRPHERTTPEGSLGFTDAARRSFWGVAMAGSQHGMSREDLRDLKRRTAERLNTPIDALIDDAIGPEWEGTPPHPAFFADEYSDARYGSYVRDRQGPPDPKAKPLPGESDFDFACRFHRWKDPENLSKNQRHRVTIAGSSVLVAGPAPPPPPEPDPVAVADPEPPSDLDDRYGAEAPWTDDDLDDDEDW